MAKLQLELEQVVYNDNVRNNLKGSFMLFIIIPSLVERGLYCNHFVRPFVRPSIRPLVRLSVSPSVRLSIRSHFHNRYLSLYWKK
jgi:hypothetical protein